jgi:hypothetical protein
MSDDSDTVDEFSGTAAHQIVRDVLQNRIAMVQVIAGAGAGVERRRGQTAGSSAHDSLLGIEDGVNPSTASDSTHSSAGIFRLFVGRLRGNSFIFADRSSRTLRELVLEAAEFDNRCIFVSPDPWRFVRQVAPAEPASADDSFIGHLAIVRRTPWTARGASSRAHTRDGLDRLIGGSKPVLAVVGGVKSESAARRANLFLIASAFDQQSDAARMVVKLLLYRRDDTKTGLVPALWISPPNE